MFNKGTVVLDRTGKEAGKIVTGNTSMCKMEGCRGHRVGVRWDDGKITYPCSYAMVLVKNVWKMQ